MIACPLSQARHWREEIVSMLHVCPTGAIRALPMAEKRVARMGLAHVETTCLPLAGKKAWQLCVDECNAAGYHAIEFMRVHPKLDESGQPEPTPL